MKGHDRSWSQQLSGLFELSRGGAAQHLRAMEGMRGIAVLMVFLAHFAFEASAWSHPASTLALTLGALSRLGNVGVDLFFVLSGFLIYGTWIARPQRFIGFMLRCVQRIYPAFLVVFGIYVLLSLAMPSQSRLPGSALDAALYIAANVLLLPGMLPIQPLMTVAWTLSYEMFFYLMLPALVALGRMRERSPRWRVAFLALLGLAVLGLGAWLGDYPRLALFLAGGVLRELVLLEHRAPSQAAGAVALILSLLFAQWPDDHSTGDALRTLGTGLALGVLGWAGFVEKRGVLTRLFIWTPLRWLGNMSYSYYLTHALTLKVCFAALARWMPPQVLGPAELLLLGVACFVVSLGPSAALFIAIERPFSWARPKTPSMASRRASQAGAPT